MTLTFSGLASPNLANAAVGLSIFASLVILATALGTTGGFMQIVNDVLAGRVSVTVAGRNLKSLLRSDLEVTAFGRLVEVPMLGLAALIAIVFIIAITAGVYTIFQAIGL